MAAKKTKAIAVPSPVVAGRASATRIRDLAIAAIAAKEAAESKAASASALAEMMGARAEELLGALGDVIGIHDRIGGFMKTRDQETLRRAKRIHGGV